MYINCAKKKQKLGFRPFFACRFSMKEIDRITMDTSDKNSEVEEVGKTVNYNFIRKKGKSISTRCKERK